MTKDIRERLEWLGTVTNVHTIGEYVIAEYVTKDGKTLFHVDGTSTSCTSLDSAILLAIGAKHMDINDAWRFEKFATRMLKGD